MKKKKETESKNLINQLTSSSSFLISVIAGCLVIVLIIYFGISIPKKATYSASGDTCPNGEQPTSVGSSNYCCPAGYTMVDSDAFYTIPDSMKVCDGSDCYSCHAGSYVQWEIPNYNGNTQCSFLMSSTAYTDVDGFTAECDNLIGGQVSQISSGSNADDYRCVWNCLAYPVAYSGTSNIVNTFTATFSKVKGTHTATSVCNIYEGGATSCDVVGNAGTYADHTFKKWVEGNDCYGSTTDTTTPNSAIATFNITRNKFYTACWNDAGASSSSSPSSSSPSSSSPSSNSSSAPVCDSSLQRYDSQLSCLVNARLECNSNGENGECQQTANGCWKIVCKGSSNTCDASNHEYSEKLNCEVNVGYDCASNGQDGECQQTANGCWTYTCVDVPSTSNCSPTSPSFFTCDTGDGSWNCKQYGYNAVTKYTSCDNNGNSVVKYGCTNDSRCAGTASNPSSSSTPKPSSSSSSSKNMDYSDAVFGDRCYLEGTNEFRKVYVTYCQSEDLSNAKCHTSKDGEEVYRMLLKTDLSLCTSSNSSNVSNNPGTGTSALLIAWIIGIGAVVYSLYYFKKMNSIN